MSKTNYHKMSDSVAEAIIEEVEEVATEVTEEVEPEVSEESIMPETVTGFVTNCARLNVRENADTQAKVLGTISEGSEVVVRSETLPNEWFKVVTASEIEGFCMSKYIKIEQ